MTQERQTTDFGYEEVPLDSKTDRVRGVFDSVADRYDLMNDLMSGGKIGSVHMPRAWRSCCSATPGLRPGQTALDLAGGTCDLAHGLCDQVGDGGHVVLSDINYSMLSLGRDRLLDQGKFSALSVIQGNAERLPFKNACFYCVTMGFGLRNVTHKQQALQEICRVIKPGGRVLILEFSKPVLKVLQPVYDAYSFRVLPALGKLVANDADSYRYLAESIRMHPDQEALLSMMSEAGLEDCSYHNLSGGIVALHMGYRY